MRQEGKDIRTTTNNIAVSYSDEGMEDAPVLVFIHGFPFNKSMWNMQAMALKNKYRVITYDVRGHGDSAEGSGNFSITLFVDDLLGLLYNLDIKKVTLCGLSMGGYIALNAIVNYPEYFEALILSDTNCYADTQEGKEKRMKTIETIKLSGIEKYADDSIKNLFAPGSLLTKPEAIAQVTRMIRGTKEQTLSRTLVALAERVETCSKLSEIKLPVLILVGNDDKITPPEAAVFMHEKIKGSKLFILKDAGHLSNMENMTEFNIQLKTFLLNVYPR